jgi:hypothetical protein
MSLGIAKGFYVAGREIVPTWRLCVSWWEMIRVWVPTKLRDIGRGVVGCWERVRDLERNRTPVVMENARPDRKVDASAEDKVQVKDNMTLNFE